MHPVRGILRRSALGLAPVLILTSTACGTTQPQPGGSSLASSPSPSQVAATPATGVAAASVPFSGSNDGVPFALAGSTLTILPPDIDLSGKSVSSSCHTDFGDRLYSTNTQKWTDTASPLRLKFVSTSLLKATDKQARQVDCVVFADRSEVADVAVHHTDGSPLVLRGSADGARWTLNFPVSDLATGGSGYAIDESWVTVDITHASTALSDALEQGSGFDVYCTQRIGGTVLAGLADSADESGSVLDAAPNTMENNAAVDPRITHDGVWCAIVEGPASDDPTATVYTLAQLG